MTCTTSCSCCVDRVCKPQDQCSSEQGGTNVVVMIILGAFAAVILLAVIICIVERCRKTSVVPSDSQTQQNRASGDSGQNSARRRNQQFVPNLNISTPRNINPGSDSKREKVVIKGVPEDKMPEMLEFTDRPKLLYKIPSQDKMVKLNFAQTQKLQPVEDEDNSKPKDKKIQRRGLSDYDQTNGYKHKKRSGEIFTKGQKRTDLESTSQPVVIDDGRQDISHISGISERNYNFEQITKDPKKTNDQREQVGEKEAQEHRDAKHLKLDSHTSQNIDHRSSGHDHVRNNEDQGSGRKSFLEQIESRARQASTFDQDQNLDEHINFSDNSFHSSRINLASQSEIVSQTQKQKKGILNVLGSPEKAHIISQKKSPLGSSRTNPLGNSPEWRVLDALGDCERQTIDSIISQPNDPVANQRNSKFKKKASPGVDESFNLDSSINPLQEQ